MLKILIKSSDFYSLPLAAAVVLEGAAGAAHTGNFTAMNLVICLLAAIMFQIFGNYFHRYSYFVANGSERVEGYQKFNGHESETSVRTALHNGMSGLGIMAIPLGLALLMSSGWWLLGAAAFMLFLLYINSFGPHLTDTPLNYLITFLIFGPISVPVVSAIMIDFYPDPEVTHKMMIPIIILSVMMGLLACNSLLMYNYMSYDNDKTIGKRTLVVLLGHRAAKAIFLIAGLLVFVGGMVIYIICHHSGLWIPGLCFLSFAVNTWMGLRLDKVNMKNFRKSALIVNFNPFVLMLGILIVYLLTSPHHATGIRFF